MCFKDNIIERYCEVGLNLILTYVEIKEEIGVVFVSTEVDFYGIKNGSAGF